MDIRLYDSYSRQLRVFSPLQAEAVRLYACGPTVYDYAHIGNLRTYIFEDILRRTLEFHGYTVHHVINITDVGHLTSDADTGEDKVEQGAKKSGQSAWEIAELYTAAFKQDLQALNIRPPAIWCKATEHIAEQIRDIEKIVAKGYAYTTRDGVYFDTTRLPNYGHLARLNMAGLAAGKRVAVGEKKNGTDFALWKFSPKHPPRQMQWESPWGVGFPGWHIECSAMAAKYLGHEFDIHCGGKDHIPVHHTNEIAQAEVCYATRLANFWMHGYFLEIDHEKMSKSHGEFLRLQTLITRDFEPLSYRYLCLTAHYRSDLKFTWASLMSARTTLQRLRLAVHSWGAAGTPHAETVARFRAQVYDDLNTPNGLAVMWEMVKSDLPAASKKATLLECDRVLGLQLAAWQPTNIAIPAIPTAVQDLVDQRIAARMAKNWTQADQLRAQITARGFELEDGAHGTRLRRRTDESNE